MRITFFTFIAISTLLLSGCGGGGGGGGGNNSTIKLNWTIPSTRMDGSHLPLSELSGYRIYYGTTIDNRNILIDIEDNTITEYSISREQDSAAFYTVTAYDTLGVESDHSNAILK